MQQDAHEFLNYLLNTIVEILQGNLWLIINLHLKTCKVSILDSVMSCRWTLWMTIVEKENNEDVTINRKVNV